MKEKIPNLVHLYADGLVGHNEQSTSIESAALAPPVHQTVAEKILFQLSSRRVWGITDDEMEDITGVCHQTLSSARCGLKKMGYVEWNGLKRKTKHKRRAMAWILTVRGRATARVISERRKNGQGGSCLY